MEQLVFFGIIKTQHNLCFLLVIDLFELQTAEKN